MPEQEFNQLAQRLKHIRTAQGLTQSAVAQRIGVNKSTITRWESGKGSNRINRAVICALAGIFDVSPSYLMGSINEPLTREAELIEMGLDDTEKLFKTAFESPLSPQPHQSKLFNHKLLARVNELNQTCLTTPCISGCIEKREGLMALKYLLAFYGIPWQNYGDTLLLTLLDSDLLQNFMHDSLSLLKQA